MTRTVTLFSPGYLFLSTVNSPSVPPSCFNVSVSIKRRNYSPYNEHSRVREHTNISSCFVAILICQMNTTPLSILNLVVIYAHFQYRFNHTGNAR